MTSIDLSHFKELYLRTAKQQLIALDEGIQLLFKNATSKEGRDAVYINAHTLVSKSMIMGYIEVGTLSQQVEKLFFAIKENKIAITQDLLVVVKRASDGLHQALAAIEKDDPQIDLSEYKIEVEMHIPKTV